MNCKDKVLKCAAAVIAAAAVIVGCCKCETAPKCPVKSGETFAFLGDSITYYGETHADGYCRLVVSGLKTMGVEVTPIFAGIGGHKSDEMLARIDADVIAKKPQWMTLSCGINDVWHATMAGRKGVPLPEFRTNVETMVQKAQAANIKVILMTATVVGEEPDAALEPTYAQYNQVFMETAQKYGCLLADTGKAVRTELARRHAAGETGLLLTVDTVHMKRDGDEVMAEAILRTLGADDEAMSKIKAAWKAIPAVQH